MWDGKSVDKLSYLRLELKTEKQRLESGMLRPRQVKKLKEKLPD